MSPSERFSEHRNIKTNIFGILLGIIFEILIWIYMYFTGLPVMVCIWDVLHLYLCIFQWLPTGPHLIPGRGLSDLSPLALCGQGVLLHTVWMQEQDTGGMGQYTEGQSLQFTNRSEVKFHKLKKGQSSLIDQRSNFTCSLECV